MVYIFGCMQLIKALKLSSSTIYVIIFLFFTCLSMPKTTTANEQLTSKLNNSANRTQIPTKFSPTLFKQRSLEGQYKDSSNAEATPVQLKACCGTKCKNFENLISMVGVECCGTTPANLIQNICCKNTLHERRSGSRYFDRCCSEIPYASDQTCCEGKVYEGIGLACCGSDAYNLHDKKKICCDRELYTIPSSFITTACCGNMLYNAWDGNEFCCGNKIYSRKFSNACCVWDGQSDKEAEDAQGYNLNTEICCNGVHDRKLFDSCCYVPDLSGPGFSKPTPVPYNSKTHCCDYIGVKPINPKSAVHACPDELYLDTDEVSKQPILCSQDVDCREESNCIYSPSLNDNYCCMKTAIPGRSVSVCMESKMENSEFNFCNLSDNSIQCPSNQECQYSSYLNDFICCDLSEDFLLPLIDAEMLLRSEIPNPLYKIEHNLQERYVLPFKLLFIALDERYIAQSICEHRKPLYINGQPQICSISMGCPFGYTCIFFITSEKGFCCPDVTADDALDSDNGCLPGQRPYILRLYNEPAHCEPNAVANRCPKGYNCQFSGLYQTFIWCCVSSYGKLSC
ncbi:Uncharacterized protein T02_1608 [Trichinella nativa]|uniref:Galaxin-like repeats domain-containing protein n=1 Tax=Trichinella nativa TaxID=6335 RepID=A0A0V1LAM2_9BILA|nr:Uncharacterized protein T02_1608 [Trichinella nativa]